MLLELVRFVGKDFLMLKKIEIISLAKNKNKFKVITSEGEYSFCEDTILNYYILKGKIFSEEEFTKILDSEQDNNLFNKTLNFISYQIRSSKEIGEYLKKHQATAAQCELIINRLTSLGYLNDDAYALNMLDSICLKKKGPLFLVQKLKEKGIAETIITKVLQSYPIDVQQELALEIAKNQLQKKNYLPAKKQKQNLYEKLLRDGFGGDVISMVLSQVEFIDDSEETLVKEITRLQIKYRNIDEKIVDMKIVANLMGKGYEYSSIIKKIKELNSKNL